jgi:FKBP-type peptidyl-prolyl cis-trans isomerase (trigger factor)
MKSKINYKVKIESLENSRAKVTVTVASKDFETTLEAAKQKVLSEAKLNGFRDGKVPTKLLLKPMESYQYDKRWGI